MRILIVIGFLLPIMSLYGQSPVITGQNQKYIHHTGNKGFILIESLQPNMTLYSISRKYNVSIDNILAINPDLKPNAIPLGYPVNIPIDQEAITLSPPSGAEERIWLSYRVQAKETLYRISKVYLNVEPEVVISLNPQAEQGLKIGQVLHVGWLKTSVSTSPAESAPSRVDSTALDPKDYMKLESDEGKVIHTQKGLAVWKPGNVSSQYYVLHPTARVGSYMEITNPMLHKTITAKVAGNIPPGLYQAHVGIVVSPSTARALGVLDQQFFARWRYVE